MWLLPETHVGDCEVQEGGKLKDLFPGDSQCFVESALGNTVSRAPGFKDKLSCSFWLIRVDTGTFCRDRAAGLVSAAQRAHRAPADLHKLLTVI